MRINQRISHALAHVLSASLPVRRDSPCCGNRYCSSIKSRDNLISQCADCPILLCQPARLIGECDSPRPADPFLSAVLSSARAIRFSRRPAQTHAVKNSYSSCKLQPKISYKPLFDFSGQYFILVCPFCTAGSGLLTARTAS